MRRLHAWGAFSGARSSGLTKVDIAIEKHLKKYPEPTEEQRDAFNASLPPSWVRRFGIVCDLSGHEAREKAGELQDRISKVLKPFRRIGEGGMTGQGVVVRTDDPQKRIWGVMFETSMNGARAVAKAFIDLQVVDGSGKVIEAREDKIPAGPAKIAPELVPY